MWYVWSIAHAPAYYAAHHKVVAQPWHAMLPGAVTLILMLLIPLWALLTDRPSGWTIPPSSAAKASADKSEIRNPRSEMR